MPGDVPGSPFEGCGGGAFTITGGVLVVCLAAFWAVVAARTIHGARHGYLFDAPCLRAGKTVARFEADVV